MAYALRQLGYEISTDDKIFQNGGFFCRCAMNSCGTLMPLSMATDTQCLTYQIPGGMLSNLLSRSAITPDQR